MFIAYFYIFITFLTFYLQMYDSVKVFIYFAKLKWIRNFVNPNVYF